MVTHVVRRVETGGLAQGLDDAIAQDLAKIEILGNGWDSSITLWLKFNAERAYFSST